MDKTNDGRITHEDIKGIYTARGHPEVLSGQMTEIEVLMKFLNVFESDPCGHGEEPTGDGVVSL